MLLLLQNAAVLR